MLKKFYPKECVDSTYHIDFEKYYKRGYRGILFDIDNTLVPHGKVADQRAIDLFHHLSKIGFECCLISNNKRERVQSFHEDVQVRFIEDAHKPSTVNYKKAMEWMGTNQKNTLFVGDQIFTDIYGANRSGIYSILVQPLHPREEIQIVLKRYLEKIVLYFYQKEKRKEQRKKK